MHTHQTGLMVLRFRLEEGSERPLRVDVRETFDLARGLGGTRTLTDVDLVLSAVRAFLESGGAEPEPGGPDGQPGEPARGSDRPDSLDGGPVGSEEHRPATPDATA